MSGHDGDSGLIGQTAVQPTGLERKFGGTILAPQIR